MNRIDHAVLWLVVRLIRWRFPITTLHVTKARCEWTDLLTGKDMATTSSATRCHAQANSSIVRRHLDEVEVVLSRLADKASVADLLHDIDTPTTTPESPTP